VRWKMTGQDDNVGYLATESGVKQFQLSSWGCFVLQYRRFSPESRLTKHTHTMKAFIRLFGHLTAVSAIVAMSSLLPQANAQPITIPQQAPYTNDAYTVLLEHFDGTTSGSANGSVTYTNGVLGQGVHLNAGSWVSWNLGALPQATVEFWGELDTLTNQSWFIRSGYSQFYACTFMAGVDPPTNTPSCAYHNGSVWIGTGWVSSPVITTGSWHHYATTWGSQGFHFYVDGALVYSNANTSAQNSSTHWWCIGGQRQDGPAFGGSNFAGAIDELRVSNIQRTFSPPPILNVRKAVYLDASNLWPGTNYQTQVSTDVNTWTNYGAPFTATKSSWRSTNYWDVDNWNELFFRLQVSP
jgi:hypothetical protein